MRTPLTNDAELQVRNQSFLLRQHSYELTQKLTYFVISIEFIFCGYMLLNAERLSGIKGASYLFVTCGIAAFFGVIWRFFYNQTYHNQAHEIQGVLHRIASNARTVSYWIYVALSITAFVWALVAGFAYLNQINTPHKTEVSKQVNQSTKQPAPLAPKANPRQPIITSSHRNTCFKETVSKRPPLTKHSSANVAPT